MRPRNSLRLNDLHHITRKTVVLIHAPASGGECLGISLETARTHLKRARRRLAELLDENGDRT